jgi:2-keto-4-pentenoate hydratase
MTSPSIPSVVTHGGAVELLLRAHRESQRPVALPQSVAPSSVRDAHLVQDDLVRALGGEVVGWKVSAAAEMMRAPILAHRLFHHAADLPARDFAPLGIEAEIAFRFDRAMPPRDKEYGLDDLAAASVALPAIEVVSSRFADYLKAPVLDRLCDLMSNGALIVGDAIADWRDIPFGALPVTLTRNGTVAYAADGGHPAGDPVGWALALVNAMRSKSGIPQGTVITTGTYSGLIFGSPGDTFEASFFGFNPVAVRFV